LAKPNKEVDKSGRSTKNIVYRDVLEGWGRCVLPWFVCTYAFVSIYLLLDITFFIFYYLQFLIRWDYISMKEEWCPCELNSLYWCRFFSVMMYL
jgi:hypothetical protein